MSDDYCENDAPDRVGDEDTPTLSEDAIDDVCRALGDRHRRRVLGYLMATDDGAATLDELLDPLASLSPHSTEHLRVALHHNHLNVLDQAGIIDYDRRSNTARYYGHRLAEELLACTATASAWDYRRPAERSDD